MKSIPHRHDWDAGTVRNPAYQARHQGEPVQEGDQYHPEQDSNDKDSSAKRHNHNPACRCKFFPIELSVTPYSGAKIVYDLHCRDLAQPGHRPKVRCRGPGERPILDESAMR